MQHVIRPRGTRLLVESDRGKLKLRDKQRATSELSCISKANSAASKKCIKDARERERQ